MPATETRSAIRDRARKRLNATNSSFWTNAQLNPEIDASGQEWYELVISAWGEGHFEKPADFTTTADTETYTETQFTNGGNDFFIARAVGIQESNGKWNELPRFSGPREYFPLASAGLSTRLETAHWDIFGTPAVLYLLPILPANKTVRVFYIPTFTKFADDSATVDGVNGWEEYIVTDLCIKYRESENKSTGVFERQKARLEERIRTMANARKKGKPSRIIVTRRTGLRPYRTI